MSEKENFDLKNWYRHNNKTLCYADKKRMKIDERQVRDMLRNQHLFRGHMEAHIGNYTSEENRPWYEHGLLTY